MIRIAGSLVLLAGFSAGFGVRHIGRPYWLVSRVYRLQHWIYCAELAYTDRANLTAPSNLGGGESI